MGEGRRRRFQETPLQKYHTRVGLFGRLISSASWGTEQANGTESLFRWGD